ncbi:hypothetical protein YTPLAS18_33820 [Nitrospira sp.]|nr:hypothetical protein YTPLAS18_33820 [Nitrospira sp.]
MRLDEHYELPSTECYASRLKEHFRHAVSLQNELPADEVVAESVDLNSSEDPLHNSVDRAILALKNNGEFWSSFDSEGVPWGVVKGILEDALPDTMDNRSKFAFSLVPKAMDQLVGPQNVAWTTVRKGKKNTTFIVRTLPASQ